MNTFNIYLCQLANCPKSIDYPAAALAMWHNQVYIPICVPICSLGGFKQPCGPPVTTSDHHHSSQQGHMEAARQPAAAKMAKWAYSLINLH